MVAAAFSKNGTLTQACAFLAKVPGTKTKALAYGYVNDKKCLVPGGKGKNAVSKYFGIMQNIQPGLSPKWSAFRLHLAPSFRVI